MSSRTIRRCWHQKLLTCAQLTLVISTILFWGESRRETQLKWHKWHSSNNCIGKLCKNARFESSNLAYSRTQDTQCANGTNTFLLASPAYPCTRPLWWVGLRCKGRMQVRGTWSTSPFPRLHSGFPLLHLILVSWSLPLKTQGELQGQVARREETRKSVFKKKGCPFL